MMIHRLASSHYQLQQKQSQQYINTCQSKYDIHLKKKLRIRARNFTDQQQQQPSTTDGVESTTCTLASTREVTTHTVYIYLILYISCILFPSPLRMIDSLKCFLTLQNVVARTVCRCGMKDAFQF
jgi:hypothetical protein